MTRTALKSLKPIQITHNVLIHNHFPNNSCISDKKNLLLHLSRYLESKSRDVFQFFPESYELNDTNHPIMDKLQQESDQHKDYWIIKPGENSNRGRGITISHNKANTIE
jgi:tubulin monoglycylase TTLL3/8